MSEAPAAAEFMREAIALARRGRGRVEPNPQVGCVIAREGRIVGRGYHSDFGGPHAEVAALADAGEAARGADAYVTLEPCTTTGKTPPCSEALIAAGLRSVTYAQVDPNPAHAGAADARLKAAGIEVQRGFLAEEAADLLLDFRRALGAPRPWVVLKWAQTLDGRAATGTGDSKWITGELARREVHAERARCRGILVGIGTALADRPRLTVRDHPGASPHRFVLDSDLRLPPDSSLADAREVPTTIFSRMRVDATRRQALEARGAEVVPLPSREEGGLDLQAMLRHIRPIGRLMVEGGPRVLGTFLRDGLWDQARIFVAPRLLAAADGRAAVEGPSVAKMADTIALDLDGPQVLGEDLLFEARPREV